VLGRNIIQAYCEPVYSYCYMHAADNCVEQMVISVPTVTKCSNKAVLSCIEGRASGSPTMDLFITLLSLGRAGYRKLLAERKEMFQYLQQQLALCAERHGQRLLKTKNNPISIGEFHKIRNFLRKCTISY